MLALAISLSYVGEIIDNQFKCTSVTSLVVSSGSHNLIQFFSTPRFGWFWFKSLTEETDFLDCFYCILIQFFSSVLLEILFSVEYFLSQNFSRHTV